MNQALFPQNVMKHANATQLSRELIRSAFFFSVWISISRYSLAERIKFKMAFIFRSWIAVHSYCFVFCR